MGNSAVTIKKIKSCIQGNPQALSYFQIQQKMSYSKQIGQKSLQHMIDIGDFGQYNSLKKVHRYLHPAFKYLQYCQLLSKIDQNFQQTSEQNFIKIHQQQLISSAGNVLLMYYQYLRKVVPANISYFHFMREKDFYIHYCALRYVLCAGQAGTLFKSSTKTIDVFRRLKIDNKLLYIKLISHWLYDMVKYRCSAIYIESKTLPRLIIINAIVLCGLIEGQKVNVLQQYQRRQKNQSGKILIYQHCLYSFNYILSEAHSDKILKSTQGNGIIQIILLGITQIMNSMWKDSSLRNKNSGSIRTMYCPSYWYVQSIGFVKNPTLETLTFQIIVDIIKKINKIENSQQQQYQNFQQSRSKLQNKKSSQQDKNKQLQDEIIQSHKESDDLNKKTQSIQNLNLMKLPKQDSQLVWSYNPLNDITHMMLYNCIMSILEFFPDFFQNRRLQQTLAKEIQSLAQSSFVRPFVLLIIKALTNQGVLNMSDNSKYQGESQRQKGQQKKIEVLPELIKYYKDHQLSYSTQNFIIPYETVGKNCRIYLKKIFPKVLQKYEKQITRQSGEIWTHLIKYNQHQMQVITK